ncbi:MAG: nuclease-related domain-containing protein [Pseudomonadota bacterium]
MIEIALILGAAFIIAIGLAVWLRLRRDWQASLARQLASISYAQHSGIVLPKADDGVIQIDLILLVADGVLVVDTKDVNGVVFGSDRMQEWTVLDGQRRFTFTNPQSALFDRVAAVRQVLRGVPVDGRLIFASGARFEKGKPASVASINELLDRYPAANRQSPPATVRAFLTEWAQLEGAAITPP